MNRPPFIEKCFSPGQGQLKGASLRRKYGKFVKSKAQAVTNQGVFVRISSTVSAKVRLLFPLNCCSSNMEIQIEEYPLSLKIGHFQAERQFVRTVFVSLTLQLAPPGEGSLEALDKTIDYGEVIHLLEEKFAGQTIHLIETLLFLIAKELMHHFPLLESLSLCIQKTHMRPSLVKGAKVTVRETFKRKDFSLKSLAS